MWQIAAGQGRVLMPILFRIGRIPLLIHIIPGKGAYLSEGFGFLHDFYRLGRDHPLSGLL